MTLPKSRIPKILTGKILTGRILTWAMIPLIVFGSLPRIGCICADGTHKAFCQRHLQGNRAGECVCCERRNVKADACESGEHQVQTAGHTCCQSAKEKCGSGCPGLSHGRPCRPVIDRTEIVTSAKSALDRDRIEQLPLFVAVELLPVIVASVEADYLRGESLPPPDLITTLGVLLI
jgi:hypothetical protein